MWAARENIREKRKMMLEGWVKKMCDSDQQGMESRVQLTDGKSSLGQALKSPDIAYVSEDQRKFNSPNSTTHICAR